MVHSKILGGAVLAVVLTTSALAQTTGASADKMALARQMVEASGGQAQFGRVLDAMFNSMSQSLGANLPPEQERLRKILLEKVRERILGIAPQMLEATVKVYADNLTDKELHDYLSWIQSESGRSVSQKLPKITAESLVAMTPLIKDMTQGLKQDVIDAACQEAKCTDADRAKLQAAMDKAMPASRPRSS